MREGQTGGADLLVDNLGVVGRVRRRLRALQLLRVQVGLDGVDGELGAVDGRRELDALGALLLHRAAHLLQQVH